MQSIHSAAPSRGVPVAVFALACVLATAAGQSAAAAQEAAPKTGPARSAYSANYRLRYLGGHAAEVLAWEQCPTKECRVTVDNGILQVLGTSEVQEKVSRALARADSEPRTQVFQLTLLLADNGAAASAGPDLPPGTQKALKDIQGFLPFKGYRVLDRALLRTTQRVSGRLIGDDGEVYEVELSFHSSNLPGEKELVVDDFSLTGSGHGASPAAGKDPVTVTSGRLIRTSFGISVGETVVVGTSKLGRPDLAMVVLLTAVP